MVRDAFDRHALIGFKVPAMSILMAALYGPADDPAGKTLPAGAETPNPESADALVEEVRVGGAVRWLAGILISATAIYERSGRGADALASGHECLQLMQDLGDEPEVGMVIAARAEWAGGTATMAREMAEASLEASVRRLKPMDRARRAARQRQGPIAGDDQRLILDA